MLHSSRQTDTPSEGAGMLSNNAYTQEYFDIMESLGGDI